uniref:Uncharacterized protein n=1 Tax=Panagrellus redivivus TaxID=6233 RepID=A0A7E4V5K3_PANRE
MSFTTIPRNLSCLHNESTQPSSSDTSPESRRRPATPYFEKPDRNTEWTPEYTYEAAVKLRRVYHERRMNHRDPNVRPPPIPRSKFFGLDKPMGQMSEKTAARIRKLTYLMCSKDSTPNQIDVTHLKPQPSTASNAETSTVASVPEVRTTKIAGPKKNATMNPVPVQPPTDRKSALMALEQLTISSVRKHLYKADTTVAEKHTAALKLLDDTLKEDYIPSRGLKKAITILQMIFMIEHSPEPISQPKLCMMKQVANRIREHYRKKFLNVKVRTIYAKDCTGFVFPDYSKYNVL